MSLKLGLRNRIRRSRAGGFTGLLDQSFASGATAAYSLRLLRADHSGGLVRVRADDNGTNKGEADVLPVAEPDGSRIITLDSPIVNLNTTAKNRDLGTGPQGTEVLGNLVESGGANYDGFVTKWYDQSGNSNDASQSTATDQPQIVNSGSVIQENGKPAIQFGGNNEELIVNFSLTTPISLFAAFTFIDDVFHALIGNFDVTNDIFFRKTGGGDLKLNPSNSSNMDTPINLNQEYIADFHLNSSEGELYVDNAQKDTNSGASASYGTNPFTIGNAGPDSTNFHQGTIKEMIIYDNVNKLSERGDIANAINSYAGSY